MATQEPTYIVAIWGPRGSGKSTLPLTLPGKTYILDLENGVHRATWRFPSSSYEAWNFPPELQFVRLNPSNLLEVDLSMLSYMRGQRVKGYIEQWTALLKSISAVLARPDIANISFDTAKELWTIDHMAHLQEKQDIQFQKARAATPQGTVDDSTLEGRIDWRDNLGQLEYGVPNSRMDKIISMTKGFGKNVILINHQRDQYRREMKGDREVSVPTGKIELDGWRKTENLADWIIHMEDKVVEIDSSNGTKTRELKYISTIEKSPYGKYTIGLKLEDATLPQIFQVAKRVAIASAQVT